MIGRRRLRVPAPLNAGHGGITSVGCSCDSARRPAGSSPHGPVDLLRQIALFAAAYYAYRLTRGIADNPGVATTAFRPRATLINIERTLNVFIEPSVQTFVSGERWLADITSWMYINAQTSITLGALAWMYLRRNPSFYFVRNMFLVAFGIALIGYTVFPTAPPRFLPKWGFIDTVAQFTGVPQDSVTVDALFNPYAAVRRCMPDSPS